MKNKMANIKAFRVNCEMYVYEIDTGTGHLNKSDIESNYYRMYRCIVCTLRVNGNNMSKLFRKN